MLLVLGVVLAEDKVEQVVVFIQDVYKRQDYYLMDGGIITVNTDTAAAMSLDYSCFDSMGTVVEVTTTKD